MTPMAGRPISTTEAGFSTEGMMGAQLNIKSDDAYRLASELASLTGESLTAAVTAALRERLERERRERGEEQAARRARIAALAAEIRASIPGPVSSADHNDLYGPDGLPA
ncbi:MAG TPA: type II toxin-antitoxin system VapB family antitoxin [Streptosporangiaceae bacterium]|nr:type II toxin-antitoxin system VapB family antitoxin [Streptosporangiaceae bacterium]